MSICSHKTAAAYSVADLCSSIIGAVKVFINKIIIKKKKNTTEILAYF